MTLVVLFVLGLAFGSFVNALVWRLHELDGHKKLNKKQRRELSVLHGRSMCPHCHHELNWHDLIPVVSWVILQGKCRYCKKAISRQYPLVELGTTGLFVLSYMVWPYELGVTGWAILGLWLIFLTGFVALVVYDLKWMELPNKIIYPFIGLAVVQVCFITVANRDFEAVIDAFWGFVVIGGLFYALFQLSRGTWIGGGDVKLGFLIGLLVGGPLDSLLVIFLASLIGTLVSLPFLAGKALKPTSRIPFGPFLLAATIVVYLFSERLVDMYLGLFQ